MTTAQLVVGGAILLFVLLAFALMALSWRRRRRAQSAFGVIPAPPEAPAEPFAVLAGLHVGTTVAGAPLNRLALEPLGFRARGTVSVGSDGILLRLDGSRDAFIPAADLVGYGRAAWTIDRGVELEGLNVLSWRLHRTAPDTAQPPAGTELETHFRMDDPAALDAALDRLTRQGSRA